MGRMTWVISSNIDPSGFYESFGFKEVDRILLGDKNPTWKEPPSVLRLVRLFVVLEMEMEAQAADSLE